MGERPRGAPPIALAGGATLSLLLLDTTFLIDAERQGESLDAAIADEDDVAIAAVSAAELLVGMKLATGKRRTAREAFIDAVLDALPALPYDLRVAHAHAELLMSVRQTGKPRGAHDLIIAATAVASGRTVLTADSTGFEDLPGVRFQQH